MDEEAVVRGPGGVPPEKVRRLAGTNWLRFRRVVSRRRRTGRELSGSLVFPVFRSRLCGEWSGIRIDAAEFARGSMEARGG